MLLAEQVWGASEAVFLTGHSPIVERLRPLTSHAPVGDRMYVLPMQSIYVTQMLKLSCTYPDHKDFASSFLHIHHNRRCNVVFHMLDTFDLNNGSTQLNGSHKRTPARLRKVQALSCLRHLVEFPQVDLSRCDPPEVRRLVAT